MNIDFHSFVDNFVSAVEAKDAYTAGHSNRVAEISLLISKELRLCDESCHMIHMAAHLHDIGKIGIADGILLKSGKLNKVEFEVMKTHSEIGYNILRGNSGLSEVSEIILSHHERYDGLGYPNGICKEEIPIGARIISVADSFDAMITKRTYKDTMSFMEAKDEIRREMGKQFDPNISSVFLDILNNKEKESFIRNLT